MIPVVAGLVSIDMEVLGLLYLVFPSCPCSNRRSLRHPRRGSRKFHIILGVSEFAGRPNRVKVHYSRKSTPRVLLTLPASFLPWESNIFSAPRREPNFQSWLTNISWIRCCMPWDWWRWVFFQCCRCRVDLTFTTRTFLVSYAVAKIFTLPDFSLQSQLVQCLFGIISLPSEWRSISFGDQSGVSWRGYIWFNGTCPFSIPCGLHLLVSLEFSQPSFPHLFLVLAKTGLTRTACQRVYIPIAGLYKWSAVSVTWRKGDCIFVPVSITIGFSASEGMPDSRLVFRSIVPIDI